MPKTHKTNTTNVCAQLLTHFLQVATSNKQQATSNQQPTNNQQPATTSNNQHQPATTNNNQQPPATTNNQQPTNNNQASNQASNQPTTTNEPTTTNKQPTTNQQPTNNQPTSNQQPTNNTQQHTTTHNQAQKVCAFLLCYRSVEPRWSTCRCMANTVPHGGVDSDACAHGGDMSSRASQRPCPQPPTTATTRWRLVKSTTARGGCEQSSAETEVQSTQ